MSKATDEERQQLARDAHALARRRLGGPVRAIGICPLPCPSQAGGRIGVELFGKVGMAVVFERVK